MSSIQPTVAPAQPPWRAARQHRLLAAAIDEMRGQGSRDLSMDQIARAAGVGKATLYRYFRTKEGLWRACLAAIVDDLEARMEAAEAAAAPAPERLEEIVAIMVQTFSHHLLPLRLLTRRQDELDQEWRRSVQDARRRLVAVLGRHFQRGGQEGFYRDLDLELVPHLIVGMVRSGVTHATGRSNEAIAAGIYDLVLRASRSPGNGRDQA